MCPSAFLQLSIVSDGDLTYSISDLSREFDITPRAIRFYEAQGLLMPARSGSRRIYSKRDFVRLKLILRAKRLGLSLAEVGEMFELYDTAHDERRQLMQFVASLAKRREQLELQRAEIDQVLAEIQNFEAQSRKLLAGRERRGKAA
jgi:DNA-binding transcriptional MerR regulator